MVGQDVKFSMAEIAKAFGIEIKGVEGISYGALILDIPIDNGRVVQFREGDDEKNDHEVKIYDKNHPYILSNP